MVSRRGKGLVNGTGAREGGREEGEGRLEHMLSLYLELTTHTQMLNTRTHLQ